MYATSRKLLLMAFISLFVSSSLPAFAQQFATVPAGSAPSKDAVNPVTNKIYVTNLDSNTVTVIDGATNETITVSLHSSPVGVAVNPVTNEIYVADYGSDDVAVINGNSNQVTRYYPVGNGPFMLAVNSVTNKIYVGNSLGGTVTIIDRGSNTTATVAVGVNPCDLAVNHVTNKIYAANCSDSNSVSIIDGTTNQVHTVDAGSAPADVAVNEVTDKIYVNDFYGQGLGVTVIDGAHPDEPHVFIPTGPQPAPPAVNPVTNKIYVPSWGDGSVTVINGADNSVITTIRPGVTNAFNDVVDAVTNKIYISYDNEADPQLAGIAIIDGNTNQLTYYPGVGSEPYWTAMNPVTNRAYVTNLAGANVTVVYYSDSTAAQFVPVTPCRLIDTRQTGGPIPGGTSRSFPIPQEGGCNIPATATAYSLNVSVVPSGRLSYLTIWPTGEDQPGVATLNSLDGRIKADAAIVPAGTNGAVSVYVTQTTNVILDINGYFAPVSGSTLAFYPLTPCRIADTRNNTFPPGLGPPFLPGQQERDFPILNAASCNIPASAAAYSLNFSVVPHGGLGYMTVWPTGQSRPLVSTLNDVPGTIIANAAIVPAGTSGDVSVYPSNDTDVIIDINGYFAPAGTGGLSLYPVAPCRVIDTRKVGSGQPFSGTLSPPVDVMNSPCGPPATAQAYVFNATVVPTGGLGYLTLWPDGQPKPLVSTLNALDGSITNNMAIVPSTNGKVDAYASGITQLILDISSYFAP